MDLKQSLRFNIWNEYIFIVFADERRWMSLYVSEKFRIEEDVCYCVVKSKVE